MRSLLILCVTVLCLLNPTTVAAVPSSAMGNTAMRMMDSVWDMMEWFFSQRDNRYRAIPWNYVNPYTPWSYTYPTAPQPGDWWAGGASVPDRFAFRGPHLWSPIDGIWRATTGEYWIVQENEFVLYGGWGRYTRGTLSVQGEKIIAQFPDIGETFVFRFWLLDGMLLLRNREGQAQVLDLIRPTAGHWQW